MPGGIDRIGGGIAEGWAAHPFHSNYRMTVHAVSIGMVVTSTMTALERSREGHRFRIRYPVTAERHGVTILLGETQEYLAGLKDAKVRERQSVTVEDLLSVVDPQPWVTGACYLDVPHGLKATIIDLLAMDYLGRHSDDLLEAIGTDAAAPAEGYDVLREHMLRSDEYRARRTPAGRAAGTIFSQRLAVTVLDKDVLPPKPISPRRSNNTVYISIDELRHLRGEAFVTACFKQILCIEPSPEERRQMASELDDGLPQMDIVLRVASRKTFDRR